MRHRKAGRHLNRNAAHRRSLFRNLSRALITHETIVTTLPKAKELRPFVERLITFAKKAHALTTNASSLSDADAAKARMQALHYRRQAMALLGPTHGTGIWNKDDESNGDTVLKKLFRELGPRYADRPGGYTRVLKQHYRRLGDSGFTAVIELLKAGEKKVQRADRRAPQAPAPLAPAPTPPAETSETPAESSAPPAPSETSPPADNPPAGS
jgi:large subunit ribosomal protein L17